MVCCDACHLIKSLVMAMSAKTVVKSSSSTCALQVFLSIDDNFTDCVQKFQKAQQRPFKSVMD